MDDLFVWSAPEYLHYKRSTDWFWAVGIIFISLITLAFFFNNSLLAILIIISAIILISFVIREPDIIQYKINKNGISINEKLIYFVNIEAFWIEIREEKLILKVKNDFTPYIIIPIHKDSISDINLYLRNFIEEKELKEPLFYKIIEYLGF